MVAAFKKSHQQGRYHPRNYSQVRKQKWESVVFARYHPLTPKGIGSLANKHLLKYLLILTLMNITTTEMSVLTGVTPGRHNILIVTPQHQPSIWKTQRTTFIQTKTRSRRVISFSCNATSNQLSTQHMQVVRKAVQMIPHGGFISYTLEELGLTKMLALEATNSLLCRHLLIFAQEIHYQEALWQTLHCILLTQLFQVILIKDKCCSLCIDLLSYTFFYILRPRMKNITFF